MPAYFKKHLRRLSLTPFILLAALATLLSLQIFRQRQASLRVQAVDQSISAVTREMKLLVDLETGFRGFLLSGQPLFLEPYEQAVGSIRTELESMRREGRLDPGALQAELDGWLAYARPAIERRQRDPSFPQPFIDAEGKQRMDRMRATVQSMLGSLENARDAERRRYDRQLGFSIFGVYLCTAIAGVLMAWFARREARWLTARFETAVDRAREEGEKYRAIFDGVKDYAIALLDARGNVLSWSPGAEALTGYPAAETVGKSIALIHPPETTARLEHDLRQAEQHGRYELEDHLVRKDGSRIWSDVVITALRERDGTLRGFSTIIRDYLRRRQIEEERGVLLRKLEQEVRSRDDFILVASHELRTPITALMLRLELMLRGSGAPKNGHGEAVVVPSAAIESVKRQSRRLSQLVETMLDVARIHIGKLPMEFAPANLSEVVHEIVADYSAQFRLARCELRTEITEGVHVVCDAARISQAVEILLSNALKYGCDGPVHVSLKRVDGEAILSVRDGGQGIAPEHHQRIFERFARLGGVKGATGLGVGLYIAREIVEAHGGRIQVSNEPGPGATFSVALPIGEVRPQPSA